MPHAHGRAGLVWFCSWLVKPHNKVLADREDFLTFQLFSDLCASTDSGKVDF